MGVSFSSFFYLSFCHFVILSFCLSVFLSFCLCHFVFLFFCLIISGSIYLCLFYPHVISDIIFYRFFCRFVSPFKLTYLLSLSLLSLSLSLCLSLPHSFYFQTVALKSKSSLYPTRQRSLNYVTKYL